VGGAMKNEVKSIPAKGDAVTSLKKNYVTTSKKRLRLREDQGGMNWFKQDRGGGDGELQRNDCPQLDLKGRKTSAQSSRKRDVQAYRERISVKKRKRENPTRHVRKKKLKASEAGSLTPEKARRRGAKKAVRASFPSEGSPHKKQPRRDSTKEEKKTGRRQSTSQKVSSEAPPETKKETGGCEAAIR